MNGSGLPFRYRDVRALPLGIVTAEPDYDSTLSQRLEQELTNWKSSTDPALAALRSTLDRVEGRMRSLLSGHDLDRALEFLRPPTSDVIGSTLAPNSLPDPAARSVREMLGMSQQLDAIDDPAQGLALGERIARRAHEVAQAMDQLLSALDPAEAISKAWHRVLAYASELVKNAVARIRQFALRIGVSSVAITLASLPPELSVTFTFGGGAS